LPPESGGYTVGVLVQTNFGGILSINGAPVGRELGRFYKPRGMREKVEPTRGGSCMIIVATDAPLSPHNLMRLAKRSYLAFPRVGSPSPSYSGDFSIAFTTNPNNRLTEKEFTEDESIEYSTVNVKNPSLTPLFMAVVDATEEAILNSLFMAEDMSSSKFSMKALPIPEVLEILKKYNALYWNKRLDPYNND
jgi:D-aminopeptidase